MSSDRARVTNAPEQLYRSVVMQQGRVTLEADWNEAQEIGSETVRADVQAIVGPAGTPDNGYLVSLASSPTAPPFDFTVGKGTMHVGGERVALAEQITYFAQPDWLNGPVSPAPNPPQREFVYLYLREQEVSAVEDPDLLEVALGGPDTAQRTRLIQRIARRKTDGADCAGALADVEKQWAQEGKSLAGGSLRLLSKAQLQVHLQPLNVPATPCEPTAQDGYLGAENQLIRVQVAGYDAATGDITLVWGYDNASFLYRVEVAADSRTLTLHSSPVDAFHQPKQNQAVEVLRAAAQLSNGQFVAEHAGFVSTLQNDYNSDSRTITLQESLDPPAGYTPAAQNPVGAPLFLRVWQERIVAKAGQSVTLDTTGLQITLSGPAFPVGDFWIFAVRPRTPQQVYPQAFLASPQFPSGPRQWACPLAVIAWKENGVGTVTDCRSRFDNLVELSKQRAGGCCTVNIRPEDAPRLQEILDAWKSVDAARRQITFCFAPGRYLLPKPLRLTAEHSSFTLEACHEGVILEAQAGHEAAFLDGLMVLTQADHVTLRGLQFHLPQVSFIGAKGRLTYPEAAAAERELTALLRDLHVSIGLRPLQCTNLAVRDCLFQYTSGREQEPIQDIFGVGIFAGGESRELNVTGCRFVHEAEPPFADNPIQVMIGYLLMPSAVAASTLPATRLRRPQALIRPLLQDAVFEDNLFEGISLAALVYADVGTSLFRQNTVRDALSGFWLVSLCALTGLAAIDTVLVNQNHLATAQSLRDNLLAVTGNAVLQIAMALARGYPLPPEFDTTHAVHPPQKASRAKSPDAPVQTLFDKVLDTFTTSPAETAKSKIARVPITTNLSGQDALTAVVSPRLLQIQKINAALAEFERLVFAEAVKQGLSLNLSMSGNTISTFTRDKTPSDCALLVWDEGRGAGSTLLLSANQLQNHSLNRPTALILLTERNVLTGNLISNEMVTGAGSSHKPPCLLLYPDAKGVFTSVSGNVLQGATNLGQLPRPGFPGGLDNWLFANAIA